MEKIELTQEQVKDFGTSLIETFKSFFKNVFKSEKPLHGKELTDYLITQTQSDEERETLQEMFEENATYHQKMAEYHESGKNIDEWYNDELDKIVRQLKPEASTDDTDRVKEAVAKQIDNDIDNTIDSLENLNNTIVEGSRKEVSE